MALNVFFRNPLPVLPWRRPRMRVLGSALLASRTGTVGGNLGPPLPDTQVAWPSVSGASLPHFCPY